jgi:hypothetical protein
LPMHRNTHMMRNTHDSAPLPSFNCPRENLFRPPMRPHRPALSPGSTSAPKRSRWSSADAASFFPMLRITQQMRRTLCGFI